MIPHRSMLLCLLCVAALLFIAGEYARGSVLPETKVPDEKADRGNGSSALRAIHCRVTFCFLFFLYFLPKKAGSYHSFLP